MSAKIIDTIQADPAKMPAPQNPEIPTRLLQFVKLFLRLSGWLFPSVGARFSWRLFSTPLSRAKHRRTDEWIDGAERFRVKFKKTYLQAYAWGKPNNPIILLVHGWESRGTAMRAFIPYFLEKGYRVVAFDGPAHGDSPGKQTDLHESGEAIEAVWKSVGHPKGIIAHSFGCSALAFLMARKPELSIEKLVLLGSSLSLRGAIEQYAEVVDLPLSIMKRLHILVEKKYGLPIDSLDLIQVAKKVDAQACLIVHDKKDEVVPFQRAELIIEAWPNAKLLVTNGFGHFRILKAPAVVKRIVDFVD